MGRDKTRPGRPTRTDAIRALLRQGLQVHEICARGYTRELVRYAQREHRPKRIDTPDALAGTGAGPRLTAQIAGDAQPAAPTRPTSQEIRAMARVKPLPEEGHPQDLLLEAALRGDKHAQRRVSQLFRFSTRKRASLLPTHAERVKADWCKLAST